MYFKISEKGKKDLLWTGDTVPANGAEITKEEFEALQNELIIRGKKINEYVGQIKGGEITLEEVPEDYRSEVQEIINPPVPTEPTYTLDEAATILAQEVNS